MFLLNLSHNRTLPRPSGHIVAKFGQYLQMLVLTKSNMANFLIQGQITRDSSGPISSIMELIRDLMVIYILTKFGADWLIFVDARELTRKLWTDGQTLTDGE